MISRGLFQKCQTSVTSKNYFIYIINRLEKEKPKREKNYKRKI